MVELLDRRMLMNTDRLFDEVSLVRTFINQRACDWEMMVLAVKKSVSQY